MRSEFRSFIMLPESRFKDKLILNERFNIIHDFNSIQKMQRYIFYHTTINSYIDRGISKLFQKIINNNIAKSYTTKFKLFVENSNAKLYSTYFISSLYDPISSTKLSKRYKSEVISFRNKNNIKTFNMKSITKNNWEIE